MITVQEAHELLFALVSPLKTEHVPLIHAAGRTLAHPVAARRNQPPFAASAMDGYAVQSADVIPGAQLTVMDEAAAGHHATHVVKPGQAVRIFTGAPLPTGANHVVIQEDVTRDGDTITLTTTLEGKSHIRPAGADFTTGTILNAPRVLSASDIALLASMNIPQVPVVRKPTVAIIATGDELVWPGETPSQDQIIASNSFGLYAMLAAAGADPRLLPIAPDTNEGLTDVLLRAKGADLVITIGGASVGDHDLVGGVAASLGMQRSFYKIAMRPGKPLMAGRLNGAAMVGLPGNPVSAMVCGALFLRPMIDGFLGHAMAPPARRTATLAHPIPANGPREHYMRATVDGDQITPEDRQDSSLLTVLSRSNALLIRPIRDPAQPAGTRMHYLPL